eukprot:CAMPEP_0184381870 /NCGR_PEP_ID=MMETSP0007-20130409/5869_1 /TAXON_ID=97485 /ORGANISM="Prymnesium parvum, Strain Texoma1" /LENGTH=97 /DNA_ID=CAMNT_0026727667 /DNA_START=152 /DNA_END=442 /DNA_ORIENTATION=+
MSWLDPQVGQAPKADVDEQVAQLDARAKHPTQLKHPISPAQPAEYCCLISDLTTMLRQADSKEGCIRLRRNAMYCLVDLCCHAIVQLGEYYFSLQMR